MAYTNVMLIETLKDNIYFDILSRNCFLFDYFVLFLLDKALEWILTFLDVVATKTSDRPQPW